MRKTPTPFFSIVLYIMSGLNLAVMLVCLLTIFRTDSSIQANSLLLNSIFGVLADILLGYAAQAIKNIGALFVMVNTAISLFLYAAARMVKFNDNLSKRADRFTLRLDTLTGK
jgi:hypothetical protein